MALTRFGRTARLTALSACVVSAAVIFPKIADATTGHDSAPTLLRSAASLTVTEPSTPAQVQARLTELSRSSEQLAERYDAAQITLRKARKASLSAAAAAAQAIAAQVRAQNGLAVSLSAEYRASSFWRTAALLLSNSGQNYLETVQSMSQISAHRAEVAQLAATAQARAATALQTAAVAASAAQAQQATLARQQTTMTAQVAKYTTLLHTLTAQARAAYYTVNAATPAQVQQLSVSPPKANSKGAAIAIAAAMAELGKPYAYGSGGPGSFDCSGLTAFAWAAAGVSLPHNAGAQYGYGTHIPPSQLQPGDLVFFYSPIGHVGIYIGNGLMIHAPTSGDVVKISSVFGNGDYVGATRIG